jgi:predicted nucleotidyltransferase
MNRDEVISFLSSHREELEARFHVASLMLFGSTARGEAGPESDVDLLVEFSETPGLTEYMRLKFWLEDSLGRPVNLVMKKALKSWAKKRAVSSPDRLGDLFLNVFGPDRGVDLEPSFCTPHEPMGFEP